MSVKKRIHREVITKCKLQGDSMAEGDLYAYYSYLYNFVYFKFLSYSV